MAIQKSLLAFYALIGINSDGAELKKTGTSKKDISVITECVDDTNISQSELIFKGDRNNTDALPDFYTCPEVLLGGVSSFFPT